MGEFRGMRGSATRVRSSANDRHVFKGEGFGVPTDERHCVNGISINFKEDE